MEPPPLQDVREELLEFLATLRRPQVTLPGVALIDPLTQGDVDGLCGLYCIINAIRLVLAPKRELSIQQVRALFAAGIQHIDHHSSLSRALRKSIPKQLWLTLAQQVVARAERETGVPIYLKQPASRRALETTQAALAAIEIMVSEGQAPMVFMRGKYRHYSVICGYTPKSLRLFDSFGYHWVRRASCGSADTPTSLHRFHVASLLAVSLKP